MNATHLAGFRRRLKYAGICCNVEQFVLPVSHRVLCAIPRAVCHELVWSCRDGPAEIRILHSSLNIVGLPLRVL